MEPERTFVDGRGRAGRDARLGRARQAGAHLPAWRRRARRLVVVRRAVLRPRAAGGRADVHRHGPFRLAARPMMFDQFVREAREAGRAAGAFEAGPPVVVGHSFGGRVAMGLAGDFGDELRRRGDGRPAFLRPQNQRPRSPPRPTRERSVQHSLDAVVARFRLAPPQACDNLFILDFIARRSARRGRRRRGQAWLGSMLRSALLGEVHPHRPDRARHGRPLAARDHPRREVAALPSRGRRLSLEPHPSRLALCRDPRGRASRDDRPADRFRGGAARAAWRRGPED